MTTERHTRELPADLITPVGAYLRLREALGAPAFLLESVERGEQVGRYSFLAAGLPAVDTLEEAAAFAASQPGPAAGAPPFAGGAVGFLSYDWVSELEPVPLPAANGADAGLPTMRFLLAETVVAFDHVRRTMTVTGERTAVDRAIDALGGPLGVPVAEPLEPGSAEAEMTEAGYIDAVERVKEHIAAGDAYQIVPSQRVRRRTGASPAAIYRALRAVNPSPYMFLLDMEGYHLIGSSPETHVRLGLDGTCELRPIAGTRPRGATPPRTTPWPRSCSRARRTAPSTPCSSTWRETTSAACEPGIGAGRASSWTSSATRPSCTSSRGSSGRSPTAATRPRSFGPRSRRARSRAPPRCGRCRSSRSSRAAAGARTPARRLARIRRRHGHVHRDPHGRPARRDGLPPVGRRHRRRTPTPTTSTARR